MHHHMAKWHKEHNYQPTLYGIDDLLNDMFGQMTDFAPAFLNTPDQKRLELEVGKENIVARLAVPGCTPADVSVEVLGDYLTIKASHHCNVNPDNDKHFIRRERSFDSYEETVRLRSHFDQMKSFLDSDQPIGRKLDFIVQEMNREANTIGSKVTDSILAHKVVDIKGEIEKIREQVQNIE